MKILLNSKKTLPLLRRPLLLLFATADKDKSLNRAALSTPPSQNLSSLPAHQSRPTLDRRRKAKGKSRQLPSRRSSHFQQDRRRIHHQEDTTRNTRNKMTTTRKIHPIIPRRLAINLSSIRASTQGPSLIRSRAVGSLSLMPICFPR